jgi:hypothetical protein
VALLERKRGDKALMALQMKYKAPIDIGNENLVSIAGTAKMAYENISGFTR